MSLPAAVLWDMDGTLVDTEPYWIAAEHGIVAEHGGTWSDEFAHQLVGNDLMVSATFIREHSPIDWSPERIVDELLVRVVAQVHADDRMGVLLTPRPAVLGDQLVLAGDPVRLGVDQRAVHVPEHRRRDAPGSRTIGHVGVGP